jgi:virulence factor
MEKVKVAFVGAGAHANRVHYPSLAEMEDVRIVGICDLNEKRLIETSEKFKIEKRYVDYKKMIEETSPDAVYIIMPPHHMFDIVIYCLNAGLNVFIEKPPGITTTQIKSMAKLAEKKGSFNNGWISEKICTYYG